MFLCVFLSNKAFTSFYFFSKALASLLQTAYSFISDAFLGEEISQDVNANGIAVALMDYMPPVFIRFTPREKMMQVKKRRRRSRGCISYSGENREMTL